MLLLLFAVAWLLHLDHASLTPPADNIEQLTWVASLEAGYYKHPPLPTWLLWLPVRLFGASARTSYAMGAAFTLGTMAVLWQLVARLRGRRHVTVAGGVECHHQRRAGLGQRRGVGAARARLAQALAALR